MKYIKFVNSVLRKKVQKEKNLVLYGQNINAASCLSGLTRGLGDVNNGLTINTLNSENTLVGIGFGNLLSSAVFAEIIFARPGMGKLIYDMVLFRNFPVVQGAVLVTTALYVCVTLFSDLAVALVDPRVRQNL